MYDSMRNHYLHQGRLGHLVLLAFWSSLCLFLSWSVDKETLETQRLVFCSSDFGNHPLDNNIDEPFALLSKQPQPQPQPQSQPQLNNDSNNDMLERVSRQLSVFALDSVNGGDSKPSLAHLSPTLIVTKGSDETRIVQNVYLCELLSVDCLDSIECLPKNWNASMQIMSMGMDTRTVVKQNAKYANRAPPMHLYPVGLSTQHTTIKSWLDWIHRNELPERYDDVETLFLNSTLYPECKNKTWIGKNCFFAPTQEAEDEDDWEMQAQAQQPVPPVWQKVIQNDVEMYLQRQQSATAKDTSLPALGHLLTAAHITRIRFNRRPMVQKMFHNMTRVFNAPPQKGMGPSLHISVHVRRADSCSQKYEMQASPLDSPSQPTSKRKCYDTAVYINQLVRVQERLQRQNVLRCLTVYLSSDDSGSLIKEIQESFPKVYETMTWHILGFDREAFNYKGSVEGHKHNNHPFLGETAVADLWLLSHGEVFIDHLGSRFGKIGYMLATARYNRFVPFFSVDGHSYCCDVDEPCAHVKPYIRSMVNCLAFTFGRSTIHMNEGYWRIGTFTRKKAALDLEEKEYPLVSYSWEKEETKTL